MAFAKIISVGVASTASFNIGEGDASTVGVINKADKVATIVGVKLSTGVGKTVRRIAGAVGVLEMTGVGLTKA
ncbi:hypothetical protein CANDROIZ_30063 [Candidatus Roizmanbacteria bacterium]|nr:hypothetical protein CANDROIZ_30063 [Candidatus Roizmanbacteria bacterium]